MSTHISLREKKILYFNLYIYSGLEAVNGRPRNVKVRNLMIRRTRKQITKNYNTVPMKSISYRVRRFIFEKSNALYALTLQKLG